MIPEHATIFKDMNLGRRPLSRLSYQIMGLNLIAVIILIIGIFYLNSYRENLTATETELLATETELYSSVLVNTWKNDNNYTHQKNILKSFVTQKNQRLRLFGKNGELVYDSELNKKTILQTEKDESASIASTFLSFLSNIHSINFDLPLYPDENAPSIYDLSDGMYLQEGKSSIGAWQDGQHNLVLSASYPIIKNDKIIAYLIVTRSDTNIARTFERMGRDVFILFAIALLITLVFSLYLSANIGHPLRFLASAAEKSREQRAQQIIPDLSYRKDEIGDLSIAMRDMTDSFIQRVNSIEQFAADVAHELKNPLTSIRSAFETLGRVQDKDKKEILTNVIYHDLHRMDRLISNISTASRLDAELARSESIPVNLNRILEDMKLHYQQQSKDFHLYLPINDFFVWGNESHLSHVFHNIFDNAFSFGNRLDVTISDQDEMIFVYCRDNGPGVPAGKENIIFNRFYSDRPAETYGYHSGLGLSIVKQILDGHGGQIEVNANTKQGAEFIIKLRKAEIV
jgi:two-component system sensor histidine kinase ChvG